MTDREAVALDPDMMDLLREEGAHIFDGVTPKMADEKCAFKRACFRAGWAAAIAAMGEREAVKIKPLVWEEGTETTTDDDNGPMEGIPRKLRAWRAEQYTIVQQNSSRYGLGLFVLRGLSAGRGLAVSALSVAKAAAQADYESATLDTQGDG